jgi:hypothetical protein
MIQVIETDDVTGDGSYLGRHVSRGNCQLFRLILWCVIFRRYERHLINFAGYTASLQRPEVVSKSFVPTYQRLSAIRNDLVEAKKGTETVDPDETLGRLLGIDGEVKRAFVKCDMPLPDQEVRDRLLTACYALLRERPSNTAVGSSGSVLRKPDLTEVGESAGGEPSSGVVRFAVVSDDESSIRQEQQERAPQGDPAKSKAVRGSKGLLDRLKQRYRSTD